MQYLLNMFWYYSAAMRRRQASPHDNGHSRPASSHLSYNHANGNATSYATLPLTQQQLQVLSRGMAGRPQSFTVHGDTTSAVDVRAPQLSAGDGVTNNTAEVLAAKSEERVIYARPWKESTSPRNRRNSEGGGGKGEEGGMMNGDMSLRGEHHVEDALSPNSEAAMSSVTLTESRVMKHGKYISQKSRLTSSLQACCLFYLVRNTTIIIIIIIISRRRHRKQYWVVHFYIVSFPFFLQMEC
jgi:hypothetical protein